MIENGFYILDESYRDVVRKCGGKFDDVKSRPIFCCLKDKNIEGLYWLIPTSDLNHRTPEQIKRFEDLSKVKDIRQAYYYVGHTTKPAVFKISKVLPVSDKYISHEYKMNGIHLVMQDEKQISEILDKLQRILNYEILHPNKLEQKISAVKDYICKELLAERKNEIQDELVTVPKSQLQELIKHKKAFDSVINVLEANPQLRSDFMAAREELIQNQKQENISAQSQTPPTQSQSSESNPTLSNKKPKHQGR